MTTIEAAAKAIWDVDAHPGRPTWEDVLGNPDYEEAVNDCREYAIAALKAASPAPAKVEAGIVERINKIESKLFHQDGEAKLSTSSVTHNDIVFLIKHARAAIAAMEGK